jgi:hypothetical protein
MTEAISELATAALNDAGRVVQRLDQRLFESFAQAIANAKTVALHGLGREGLQMKGLPCGCSISAAMRMWWGR